jgi:hypothetical protein
VDKCLQTVFVADVKPQRGDITLHMQILRTISLKVENFGKEGEDLVKVNM